MRTIAVDFDGVIHSYEKGWQDGSIYGTLMEGALDGLLDLMSKYAVYIFTSRNPKQVGRWIEAMTEGRIRCTIKVPRTGFWNEQGKLLITNMKLPAFAYIDDRGIRFKKWSQTLTALAMFEREKSPGVEKA